MHGLGSREAESLGQLVEAAASVHLAGQRRQLRSDGVHRNGNLGAAQHRVSRAHARREHRPRLLQPVLAHAHQAEQRLDRQGQGAEVRGGLALVHPHLDLGQARHPSERGDEELLMHTSQRLHREPARLHRVRDGSRIRNVQASEQITVTGAQVRAGSRGDQPMGHLRREAVEVGGVQPALVEEQSRRRLGGAVDDVDAPRERGACGRRQLGNRRLIEASSRVRLRPPLGRHDAHRPPLPLLHHSLSGSAHRRANSPVSAAGAAGRQPRGSGSARPPRDRRFPL